VGYGRGAEATHFDGTSWTRVLGSVGDQFGDATLAPNDLWTGGSGVLQHFDGTNWNLTTITGVINGVAVASSNDVWAVGTSPAGSGTTNPLIEHWDGTAWSVVPSVTKTMLGAHTAGLSAVAAIAFDNAWAVGYAADASGTFTQLLEHWDGVRWSVVPGPVAGGLLYGITAGAPDNIWAVGRALPGSGNQPLIEHWDGMSWSVVPGASAQGWLQGVAMVSSSDIWAVGLDDSVGATSLIEHWDGATWQVVPLATRPFRGVTALPNGNVYGAASSLYELCELRVLDSGTLPATATGVKIGSTVAWSIDSADAAGHSITDASGLGLFDSGVRAPGGSFTHAFDAAGSYPVVDNATGRQSTVQVAITGVMSGDATTPLWFALTWATASAAPGYAYDVQLKRPGTTTYTDLYPGTTDPSGNFVPDAGSGKYAFRARLRNTSTGASTGWSSTKTMIAP
jgi:hypothetical protein